MGEPGLLDDCRVVSIEHVLCAHADEVNLLVEGESALQKLALDEPCPLLDEFFCREESLVFGGVQRLHADFRFHEFFAEPDFHAAYGAHEVFLFGRLEKVHEECPECRLLHVEEERLQVRADFVVAGERYDIGAALFCFGEELLEVVLEVDDGIVQHEQPVEIAHGFLRPACGGIADLELEVTVPHPEIETVVPREEELDLVVGDEIVGILRKLAVVGQEHYMEVRRRKVPEREPHVTGKVFPSLVTCIERDFLVGCHNEPLPSAALATAAACVGLACARLAA